MNRALARDEALAYVTIAEGLALLRIIADRKSSTVITRASSLFVSTYNQNSAAIRAWLQRIGSPAPAASIVMQSWGSQHAEVLMYLLQGADSDGAVRPEQYVGFSRTVTSVSIIQHTSESILNLVDSFERAVSIDRDPMPEFVSELAIALSASPYVASAVDRRITVAMSRLTAVYNDPNVVVGNAQNAGGDVVADTRKMQDRVPGGSPTMLDINDTNAYQIRAQRPGRETAIPAAVWVIGAGVVIGGIGLLVLRKKRSA